VSLDQALDLLNDDGVCRIRTRRYALAPLALDDIPPLLTHFADPRVTRFLDIEPLVDRSDARDVIDWADAMRVTGSGVRWAIRDREGGFVGTCGFHMMTFERGRRAELGYDLRPDFWGQGTMDEVLPVVLDFGFRLLGLRRIEAMVTPGNDHSCAVLARHGFRREGVLRDYAYWKSRFWDQILFARLSVDQPPG
jgi:ribosomal-protein-alanine N-acetyltransferase